MAVLCLFDFLLPAPYASNAASASDPSLENSTQGTIDAQPGLNEDSSIEIDDSSVDDTSSQETSSNVSEESSDTLTNESSDSEGSIPVEDENSAVSSDPIEESSDATEPEEDDSAVNESSTPAESSEPEEESTPAEESSSAAAEEKVEVSQPQSGLTFSNVKKDNSQRMQAAYQNNHDVVGWLMIPNTNIDHPIVKDPYFNYYIYRDYNKKYNSRGATLWGDAYCTFGTRNQLCKNTIIYGHNWTNCYRPLKLGRSKDTFFAQLPSYDFIDFARENPYINFSTLEEEMYWQVFAVFYTDTNFYYIDENPKNIMTIVNEARKRSIHNFDVNVTSSDKILTLSTCTRVYGERDDQRFVVMAKLMPKGSSLTPVTVTKNPNPKKPQF